MNKPQTTWMWQDETTGGVSGVTVDLDKRLIYWYDEPGCACDDADDKQTIAEFLAMGSRFITPPDDVLAEMRTELAQWG